MDIRQGLETKEQLEKIKNAKDLNASKLLNYATGAVILDEFEVDYTPYEDLPREVKEAKERFDFPMYQSPFIAVEQPKITTYATSPVCLLIGHLMRAKVYYSAKLTYYYCARSGCSYGYYVKG